MKLKDFTIKLRHYVDGNADTFFEYFILFVVFANSVSLGFQTSVSIHAKYGALLSAFDQACLWIFIIELLIKFVAYNRDFFKFPWNVFDLAIVAVSILASMPCFSVFRVLRISRSIKIVRAIKAVKTVRVMKIVAGLDQLQKIIFAIVKSIPGILWTLSLLLIFYYVYAIVGTNIFGEQFPEEFGSLGRSLYTLFRLMIFDSFGSTTYPIIQAQNWAWIYFLSFSLISAFVIMNVIVGIVVDSIEESHRRLFEEGKEKERQEEITLEKISAQIAHLQSQLDEMKKNP